MHKFAVLAAFVVLAGCSRPESRPTADACKMAEEGPLLVQLRPAVPAWLAEMKVRWHASPEEAVAAARRSGRPVMVFDLLGRLDEEFC